LEHFGFYVLKDHLMNENLPELEISPDLKALTIHGPWA